jgi:cellulose biosynthesis protein BcsQ
MTIFKDIAKIFINGYGFDKSINLKLPVDKDCNPLPLYSYPAIEYLQNINFKNKEIFEFGSGNSTLFWLHKQAKVTTVENSNFWHDFIKKKLDSHQDHKFIFAKKEEYINSILLNKEKYDVIIIDGNENRFKCTKNAIKKIKNDGIIIIDNSDWFENSTKLVREELNFIQVDFYGFRPSKNNTSVTSIFFSRNSNLRSLGDKQPSYSIGGNKKHSRNDFP